MRKQIGDSASPENGSSTSDGMPPPKIRPLIFCTKGRQRGFSTWRNSSSRNLHQLGHCRSEFTNALSAPPSAVMFLQPAVATRPARTVVIKEKLPSVAFLRILYFQSPREMASRLGPTTQYTLPRLLGDPENPRLLVDPENRPTGTEPKK